jgi:hypothetical protein
VYRQPCTLLYVGCDVGGRNSDHKCGVLLTSRRHGIYLIIFLLLASRSSECKDDRLAYEDIKGKGHRRRELHAYQHLTRGFNANARRRPRQLSFDAAGTRKRRPDNWSITIQARHRKPFRWIPLLSSKRHNWVRSLKKVVFLGRGSD